MKITLNRTTNINNSLSAICPNRLNQTIDRDKTNNYQALSAPSLSMANFPNVSFRMNPYSQFLLNQTKWLPCAYSGKMMISPFEIRNIDKKLAKRPNAQSAVNFLTQYEKYMHEVEAMIFDIFQDAPYKGKRDFQDILLQLQPEALLRLEDKQLRILNSKNKLISKMSPEIREQIINIRDNAQEKMLNGTFTRKGPLDLIKNVKVHGDDLQSVVEVYQAWYKLPSSTRDVNAFIVQYSKQPHEAIAKRLLSTAVGTIEHIKPASRGGSDDLSNFLLVSSRFNNDRNTMTLDEYIMLNDEVDIKENIQRYINLIVKDLQYKKSPFYEYSWYPESIQKTVRTESRETFTPEIIDLNLTKAQKYNNNCRNKLSKKFNVNIKPI